MVNAKPRVTIEFAAGCASAVAGSTVFPMNDLSRLLGMPMKTIEAIVHASRLKTILTKYQ